VDNTNLVNPESIAKPSSINSWAPHALTFNTKYAYVVDNNTNGSTYGNIWLYNVNLSASPTLENPIQALTIPKEHWVPEDISFYTLPVN